ncbi:CoA-binding protein [Pontibacillus litoralis]|uniref:CoA-binding protein n=1 Tax=Pontibacillus litoralis TaxID=516703 RepID=UPI001E510AEF|nr:CoA-binding protein [Pontibacillus litoralis]
MQNPTNEQLKEILTNASTIAVVGLSNNPERTSYQVSKAMQDAGYKIIPVNPTIDEALGERAIASLAELEEPVDIINVFRRSEYLPDVAREAVQTNAPVFWAQQGIQSDEANDYLREHGVTVIMDVCIKVAHSVTIGK